jgi:ACS family tartrate transporter-like MFS transporter
MGVLYLLAFIDRVNVGLAALTMNRDLDFSPAVFGKGAGVFFLGYVLLGVPSNLMLHRVGARRWIAFIMVAWGGCSAAMSFVRTPGEFYVLRFLLGVAEAGFFPGMILYLAYWFPKQERARVLGAFMVALPLSSAIGAPISASLLDLSARGLQGWQWMFLLEGLPAAIAGALALKWLTDRPSTANWLTLEERSTLIRALQEREVPTAPSGVCYAIRDFRVWRLSVAYFALLVALYGYSFWLPQIIDSLGAFSRPQVGELTALPSLVAAPMMYLWGRHADASGERRWNASAAMMLAAGSLLMGAAAQQTTIAIAALTAASVGIYSSLPVFWSLSANYLTGASAAAGIALINSVGNIGGFVGSTALGYLKQASGGYRDGLLFLALSLVIGAVLVTRSGVPNGRARRA